jgi:HAMP domain-containing protein
MIQGTPLPPPALPIDLNVLVNQIAPLIGGIAALIVTALVARWFFRSPIAEAIAEGIRLRRRRRYGEHSGEVPAADGGRVEALEDHIAQLQSQVSELAERLDFTERVLAERRERKLGAGQ